MKYIISESKLQEFISNYIDKLFVPENVSKSGGGFIIIWDPWEPDFGGEDERDEFMEFDYSDGRLWVKKDVLRKLEDLFNLSWSDSIDIIKERFEDFFGVEVKYVDV